MKPFWIQTNDYGKYLEEHQRKEWKIAAQSECGLHWCAILPMMLHLNITWYYHLLNAESLLLEWMRCHRFLQTFWGFITKFEKLRTCFGNLLKWFCTLQMVLMHWYDSRYQPWKFYRKSIVRILSCFKQFNKNK